MNPSEVCQPDDAVNDAIGYWKVFRRRHAILPVIHVKDEEQALRNADIARRAGCDGVFLINHTISHEILLSVHHAVVREHSEWWVGVNCLGLVPEDVFQIISSDVAGVWAGCALIREDQDEQPAAVNTRAKQVDSGWRGLYFGGVAFKYQRQVRDYGLAARRAMPYMDVVTTSGSGTGEAASVSKIAEMKKALGAFPLAIASGITPENVVDYLPVADCFLVATGIAKSFSDLDPRRVRALMEVVRGYDRNNDAGLTV